MKMAAAVNSPMSNSKAKSGITFFSLPPLYIFGVASGAGKFTMLQPFVGNAV